MKKYTKAKQNDCVICGEPCMRRLCRRCFVKDKYKGKVSTLRSIRNRK